MQHFQRFRIMFGLGRNGETFRRSWMRPTLRCSGFSGGPHCPAFPRQPQPGICCSLAPGRCLGHWYRGQPKVVSPFRFHYERAHFKSWGCPPRKKKLFWGPNHPSQPQSCGTSPTERVSLGQLFDC